MPEKDRASPRDVLVENVKIQSSHEETSDKQKWEICYLKINEKYAIQKFGTVLFKMSMLLKIKAVKII